MRGLRRHLTYSNLMVTILAVLVVGGGSVYAAETIGGGDIKSGAISSRHIRHGQVKTNDLARQAVTPSKTRGLLLSSAVSRVRNNLTFCGNGMAGCQGNALKTAGFVIDHQCDYSAGPRQRFSLSAAPAGGEIHWAFVHGGNLPVNGDHTGTMSDFMTFSGSESATGTILLSAPHAMVSLAFNASVGGGSNINTADCHWQATVVKS